MKKIIIAFIVLLIAVSAFGQNVDNIPAPKEIKLAITKGTRTNNGNPGENYFANKVDYDIKAEFNPETSKLKGKETIYYTNNSNDSLQSIIINLYQNILKKGNGRDWDIEADLIDLHDGVEISSVKYNGEVIGIASDRVNYNRSVIQIGLSPKLPPKSKGTLEIEWSFIFPETMKVRYGKFGEGNYLVAYWYPKVAVYDDIYGWDIYAYTGNQEFYNDFGDYNVEITVPGNYNVWSSGVLQNVEEIYSQKYIDRMNQAKKSDEVVDIITGEDRIENKILKKADKHVWKFKAENMPDFTFALTNNYLWNAISVESGEKRVLINNIYNSESNESEAYAMLSKKSIHYFTNEIPAIPYPYNQVTVFESTGMEFPGLVGSVVSPHPQYKIWDINTVAHEIAHAYYPFQAGFNEQKYAWMDEGLVSFFPLLLVQKETDVPLINYTIMAYNQLAGTIRDVPLMVPSMNLSEWDTYTFHAYYHSAVAFNELYKYLGKDKFVQGLQLLTANWKGKHPSPYDLFNTFNEVAAEDLSWFWDPWFFGYGYADLGIAETSVNGDKMNIRIQNEGGVPVRTDLKVIYTDDTEEIFEFPASVWKDGSQFYNITLGNKEIKSIQIGNQEIPDTNPVNNTFNPN